MREEKYFISVGEPWDFESQDGQNIIRGKIINIKDKEYLIFKSNHLLRFDSIKGIFWY
jgi:hypothetical protein